MEMCVPGGPLIKTTRDLAPYFRQKHQTLCCPKEKMWMRIYPRESALPIAHQKPSPPPAVKEKCQSNEGMRSVEKVIQWWSLQPLCFSREWKRQSDVSNWPHFGQTPPLDMYWEEDLDVQTQHCDCSCGRVQRPGVLQKMWLPNEYEQHFRVFWMSKYLVSRRKCFFSKKTYLVHFDILRIQREAVCCYLQNRQFICLILVCV